MEWFKFYQNKWLSDPAICSLSPYDKLIFITLLCLASQTDERDGVIKYIDERSIIKIAGLDSFEEETNGWMKRFVTLGLTETLQGQKLLVINFEKRQNKALTSAERVRNYRARQKGKLEIVTKCNEEGYNVTLDKIREDKIREDISNLKKLHNHSSVGEKEKEGLTFEEVNEEGEIIKKKSPKGYHQERLKEIVDYWNSLPALNATSKTTTRNPSAKRVLLPPLGKITTPLSIRMKVIFSQNPDNEDIKYAIKQYALDIMNRVPKDGNDYHEHRLSFYEFFNQKNGFIKFLHR